MKKDKLEEQQTLLVDLYVKKYNISREEAYPKLKAEFLKLFDDLYEGRYPWRFIYLCQDAGCSQEFIDAEIREQHNWISQQPDYDEKRKWQK